MTPYVCIYASQVAMCIGANRHKKISDAVELVWQRASPATFHAAMRRNHLRTEDEAAADVIDAHDELRSLVDLTLTAACESSDQVARRYDAVARELRAVPLAEDDRKLVDDVLKRNLYTGYGNGQERSVLEYIRGTLGIECHPDPTFYKLHQGTCVGEWGEFPWFVGGKIDAIDSQRSLLIEIKNRVNRLFYRVPFYEQVQVQTYLHLLGLDRGVLVECLKTKPAPGPDRAAPGPDRAAPGADHAGECAVNVIPIARDRELWAHDIVPKLDGFVDFLARLMHDPGLQDRYLQSKRRSAMVTAHVNARLAARP